MGKNDAVVAVLTEDRVRELIEQRFQSLEALIKENFKSVLTEEHVRGLIREACADLITKDQWNEALDGMLSTAVPLTGIRPDLAAAGVSADPIPEFYLDGLSFRTSRQKPGEGGKTVNIPVERALTADDVLSWRDNGATVTIVAADGQKHTVDK